MPTAGPPLTRAQALLTCVTAFLSLAACAAICAAAGLVPAPPAVIPLLACVCVVLPVLMCWRVPGALEVLRARRNSHASALAELRRYLDQLPEVEHPLGR